MLTTIVCAGLLAFAGQGDRVEIKFKSNLARFKTLQWESIVGANSGLQVAETAAGLPTGTWVFFDIARNTLIIGSREGQAKDIAQFIEQFDYVPKRVQFTFAFTQPGKGFEMKGTLTPLNNQPLEIGSPECDGTLSIRPRINDDGTVTLNVTLKVGDRSDQCSVRVNSGDALRIQDGKMGMGPELKKAMPTSAIFGPKTSFWQPYGIEVKAEILKS